MLDRRTFIETIVASAIGAAGLRYQGDGPLGSRDAIGTGAPRAPRILVVSGWQIVNIGDIAHTFGLLALLEKHAPGVEVQLMPRDVRGGVKELLLRRFSGRNGTLGITIVGAGSPGTREQEIAAAYEYNDFLLHSSGPYVVAEPELTRWAATGKPYGIYGVTLGAPGGPLLELLRGARFVYLRDRVSVGRVKGVLDRQPAPRPVVDFAPDAAFATDIRNPEVAGQFARDYGLENGRFLCCIPRLRYTPYWEIENREPRDQAERDKQRRNEETKDADFALLRAAVVAATEAGMRVLLCPEDRSQVEIGRRYLYNELPVGLTLRDRADQVAARRTAQVVLRESFWLTDEAVSIYRRSAGLFGYEMHSPILCIGNGVPAIVGRSEEQTSKGTMWNDIGLPQWLFDIGDEASRAGLVPAVREMAANPAAARATAEQARDRVRAFERERMANVASAAGQAVRAG